MKILITGGNGMLGRTLQKRLAEHELYVADLPEMDILEEQDLTTYAKGLSPDVIIHCAAMTRVDDCEANQELAFRLNGMGSANVAKAAQACGARLIAISTDYVFSGFKPGEYPAFGPSSSEGYLETDQPLPATVYGKSKLAGERSMLDILPTATIVRIAWLYGAGGPSFVHTMAKLGAQVGEPLKVVDDQRGNPTSTTAVANLIAFLLVHPEVQGIVHGTCTGICSWYDLTMELFSLLGSVRPVVRCTTAEFPRPAPRPAFSALAKGVLGKIGYEMPDWKTALREFVSTEFKNHS
ncbi:MAG: dTDP-4-dehydrorhamnose reductase [Kiritimatiellae bacterium]|nr:dTDP-4-dehydrorhamnose reductase [Kiritimatiellia bacterium]